MGSLLPVSFTHDAVNLPGDDAGDCVYRCINEDFFRQLRCNNTFHSTLALPCHQFSVFGFRFLVFGFQCSVFSILFRLPQLSHFVLVNDCDP